MDDEFVWLRYPPTGGVNHFPVDAAEVWQARGWEPCEAPPDDESHLRDPAPLYVIADPAPGGEAFIPKPARRRQNEE